jgi:hypothetical protein
MGALSFWWCSFEWFGCVCVACATYSFCVVPIIVSVNPIIVVRRFMNARIIAPSCFMNFLKDFLRELVCED